MIDAVGAVASAVRVKLPAELLPALSNAVTVWAPDAVAPAVQL